MKAMALGAWPSRPRHHDHVVLGLKLMPENAAPHRTIAQSGPDAPVGNGGAATVRTPHFWIRTWLEIGIYVVKSRATIDRVGSRAASHHRVHRIAKRFLTLDDLEISAPLNASADAPTAGET
jgi:hypothetical protein